MRPLLLLASTFVLNLHLFAQNNALQSISAYTADRLAAAVARPPITPRNNAVLRLDSIRRFQFDNSLDSIFSERTRFFYTADTLVSDTTELNLSSSDVDFVAYPKSVNRTRLDAQGRTTQFDNWFWDNLENAYLYAGGLRYYWRNTGVTLYDSIYSFTPNGNNVGYNDGRTYYLYAPGTDQLKFLNNFRYDANLALTLISQNEFTYYPDGQVASITTSSLSAPGSLPNPIYRQLYTYSNDSTLIINQLYNDPLINWLSVGQEVRIADPLTGLASSYSFYNADDNNVLTLSVELLYTYDPEGRLAVVEYRLVGGNRTRTLYTYEADNFYHSVSLETRFGNAWVLTDREYYFYNSTSDASSVEVAEVVVVAAPNPATDAVWLDAGSQAIQAISVFDQNGRLVRTLSGVNQPTVALERGGLPAGVYRVQVQTAQGSTVLPLIFN